MDLRNQVETIRREIGLEELESIIQENEDKNPESLEIAIFVMNKASNLLQQRKQLHSCICNFFHDRFPDLSSIVSDYNSYAILAKYLSNHDSLEDDEIKEYITQQQVVAVTLALAQQLGPPFESSDFNEACDLQVKCTEISSKLSMICSRCVEKFAPNMCALVGPEITAILITYAGGLDKLSLCPACNIKTFGSNKSALLGFSSRSTGNHQGIIYTSEIVQQTDPQYRDSVFRDLSGKVALCAKVDAGHALTDGSFGKKEKFKIQEKVEKKMDNKTPKYIKPLPVPDLVSTKTRGGRQARANKKKFGLTEELKNRQKVAFGVGGQFSEVGEQYGVTAFQKIKKITPKSDEPFQRKIEKKLQALEKSRK